MFTAFKLNSYGFESWMTALIGIFTLSHLYNAEWLKLIFSFYMSNMIYLE